MQASDQRCVMHLRKSAESFLQTCSMVPKNIELEPVGHKSEGDRVLMNSDHELAEYARKLEIANRELLEAREMALRAVKTKSDFLSNMSHELRTPLNSVLGMSELLNETNLDAEQKGYLSILRRNGESLLHLIDDILNFSRLEGGELPLNCAPFMLNDVIQKVSDMLKPLAGNKNLELKLDLKTNVQRQVLGDDKKLEQVLVNLIGNAIKFTAQGTVTLKVLARDANPNEYLFVVQDTGIGIPNEKLGELFKRFSQADSSITKSYGGTGLGLAISKQMVELMDGTIWVESTPQKGSSFYFTAKLPLTQVAAPKTSVSNNHDLSRLQGLRILLAEDSADNSLLVSIYLKGTGCFLDWAENGKIALDKFETGNYDLILMDMQMPEMDGYSATRWIRILEKNKSKRPYIIALTAYAMKEEMEKSLAAGCNMHLTKPLTKVSLLNALFKALDSEKSQIIVERL